MENKAAISHSILQHEALFKIMPLLDQFKSGLEKANILSVIQKFPNQLAKHFIFFGSIDLQQLLHSLDFSAIDEKSVSKYLKELDNEGIHFI
jgi:hemerythrin